MKYIDAERLKVEIEKHIKEVKDVAERFVPNMGFFDAKLSGIYDVMAIIDSLQQDETQVDKMLCSQIWWEEQGWIMIPPDATIEGIDSLLRQVKKKLQQEQPSLPDNLDEAAEEYRQGEVDSGCDYIDDSDGDSLYHSACLVDAFKAGAEWGAKHLK